MIKIKRKFLIILGRKTKPMPFRCFQEASGGSMETACCRRVCSKPGTKAASEPASISTMPAAISGVMLSRRNSRAKMGASIGLKKNTSEAMAVEEVSIALK